MLNLVRLLMRGDARPEGLPMFRLLLSMVWIVAVTFVMAPFQPAAALGDGDMGWCTAIGPGASACGFATAYEACKKQHDVYASQVTYYGAVLVNNDNAECSWADPPGTIYPSIVEDYCAPGYAHSFGGSGCIKSGENDTQYHECTASGGYPNPQTGHPINIQSGAKIFHATDFETADGLLKIERNYRSINLTNALLQDQPRGFASGWRPGFDVELSVNSSGGIGLHMPDGASYGFTMQSNGTIVPNFNVYVDSIQNTDYQVAFVGTPPSNLSQLTQQSTQWKVTDPENRTWLLQSYSAPDVPGSYLVAQPVSVTFLGGYTWNFTYGAQNQLQSITDSFGRIITFSWIIRDLTSYGVGNLGGNGGPYVPRPVAISEIDLPDSTKLLYTYDEVLNPDAPNPSMFPDRLDQVQHVDAQSNVLEETTYAHENTQFPTYVTGITDARGVRVNTVSYDGEGRATMSELADGLNQTDVAFEDPSTTSYTTTRTVTNALGKQNVYNFEYQQGFGFWRYQGVDGQASQNTAASGSSVTLDPNTYALTSETDNESRVTDFARESRGLPTSITRGYGSSSASTTTTTWDATWRVPDEIVQPGLTTDYTWNSTGQLTSLKETDTTTQSSPYSTNGQSRSWTYGYTGVQLTSITDPLSNTIHYAYNSNGYLASVTDQLGHVTTINSVNARGEPTSVTDPNGIVTALAYDALGRLTTTSVDTANTPSTTTIAYDAVGDITSITDPIGAVQTLTYDDARRLTEISNSAGESINYVRDAMGNATSITVKNSAGSAVYSKTQMFDELGRLIKSIGSVAANSTYQFGYDKTDNLVSITDPRSYMFSYGFDALNRLVSETDEESAAVNLTRNGNDKITAYQDARSLQTTYVRDGFGDIIQESSPDKGTTVYVYDARGLLTQRTDPRGVITYYTYDNAGRLLYYNYANDSTHEGAITWDISDGNYGIGRPVGVQSGASGLDWRLYDTKGNIITDWRTVNSAPTLEVDYSYDLAGNITSMTYPSGRIVTYARDSIGRVSGVTTQKSAGSAVKDVLTSVTWNPYGPISFFYLDGLPVYFTFDTDYRVTRVRGDNGTKYLDRSYSWTGETLDSSTDNQFPGDTPPFNNSYQSQVFTYTPTHRLASAQGFYGTLGWTYDSDGNRLTETTNGTTSTYSYPATSNRLSSVTPGTEAARNFTYDAAGNVLTDSRTGGLGMTFTYDVEGRVASAYQTNNPANGGSYAYDWEGKLASRTVNQSVAPTSTTTLYVYDLHHHIIAETDANGNTLREYIWLNDLPIAVVDNVNTSPVTYYILTDHLGRPARVLADDGTWVWDVIYSPFGGISYIDTNPSVMNLQFPGQYYQMEIALDNNWHRQYDPTLGRYLQPDPLINDDGNELVGGEPLDIAGLGGSLDDIAVLNASVSEGSMLGSPTSASLPPGAFPSALPQSRALLPDGPAIYNYARQSPMANVDPSGLQSLSISTPPNYSPIPWNNGAGTQLCLKEESCTDNYVKCQESVGNAPFGSGYNCGSCNLHCVAQGRWPFTLCPY